MRTDGLSLDHDVAERLLDGVAGDPSPASRTLAGLFAAASAPGGGAELAGEEAAVAAFHRACSPGASSPQESGRARFPLVRLLPVKFAAVALATATAAGGMVIAVQAASPSWDLSLPGPSSSGSPTDSSRTSPGPQGTPGEPKHWDKRPSPAIVGLCHWYTELPPARRPEALDKPSMRPLILAAGGKDEVDAYCTFVLTSPSASPEKTRGKSEVAPGKGPEDKVGPTPKRRPDDKPNDDGGTNGTPGGDDDSDDDGGEVPKSGSPGVGESDADVETGDDDNDRAVNDGTTQPGQASTLPVQEPSPRPGPGS